LPLDPDPMSVNEIKYGNKKLNDIMKNVGGQKRTNEEILNELVGRKKEMIDKSKVEHKQRISNKMKNNLASNEPISQAVEEEVDVEVDEKEVKEVKEAKDVKAPKFTARSKEDIKSRLQKKLADKKAEKVEKSESVEHVEYDNKKTSVEENIDKMKQMYNKLVQEKKE